MKRILMISVLVLAAGGMIFAQQANRSSQAEILEAKRAAALHASEKAGSEKITVSGNLTIVNGMAAIKSNNTVYLIPRLIQYAGFIEGLKDGARVSIEGIPVPAKSDTKAVVLMLQKLTIGSKEYDMELPFGDNFMPRQGMMMQKENHHGQANIQGQQNLRKQENSKDPRNFKGRDNHGRNRNSCSCCNCR